MVIEDKAQPLDAFINALAEIGPAAKAALPAVIQVLHQKSSSGKSYGQPVEQKTGYENVDYSLEEIDNSGNTKTLLTIQGGGC